jgi:glycosyltransferase involved in cell wall biosynthesis
LKISVYITSYNQKEFLIEAVNSVLAQTLPPYEIIIVDDYSDDGSREIIKAYAEKYENIRYIFHHKNKGVSQTRITALSNVTGDYVTYVDGDDIFLPNKLELESKLISETDANVAFSNNMYVAENDLNDMKWVWMNSSLGIDRNTNLFVKTITRDFPRTSLFRMELIEYSLLKEIGFHDPKLKIYEDYDLRIRLSQKAKFAYSDIVTSKIRINKAGLSKSKKSIHLKSLEYIFKKYHNDINKLDVDTQFEVNLKLSDIIDSFSKNEKSTILANILNRIKNKFIRLSKK